MGDASLGEWRHWGGKAFHIRRRLSAAEERRTGPVADIRCTPEAWVRALAVEDRIHLVPAEVLAEELGAA